MVLSVWIKLSWCHYFLWKKKKQKSFTITLCSYHCLLITVSEGTAACRAAETRDMRLCANTSLAPVKEVSVSALTFALFFSQSSSQHLLSGLLPIAELKELCQQVACMGTEEPGTLSLNSPVGLWYNESWVTWDYIFIILGKLISILPSKHWGFSAALTRTDQWGAWRGSRSLQVTQTWCLWLL